MNSVSLGEIVAALGGQLQGDAAQAIARIAPLESADGEAITFVAQPRLRAALAASTAGAIVLAP
ncbi:MAG TPA: LpxD N-terminal domain-containing protein, partial [Burkholderiaceae bacterium]